LSNRSDNNIYAIHDVEEHLIRSRFIDQTYRIKVKRPMSRADATDRFPVLYVTDSDDLFGGVATLANILQAHGETPRFILVGIGYAEVGAAGVLRMRDYYSHADRTLFQTEIERVARSSFVTGVPDLGALWTTDASEFLRFIREELMPFVSARYSVVEGDNSYFGYSAGAAFGLHTLFTEPHTFRRYVLGSPSTSYGGRNFAIPKAEAYANSSQRMDVKVFMCVGELEELKPQLRQFDLVSGYYQLAKFLKRAEIPGLDLTLKVFPEETHATAWAPAFGHGLRALFGPAGQVPFWPG